MPLALQVKDLEENDRPAYHLLQIARLLPAYTSMSDLQFFWHEWTKIFRELPQSNGTDVGLIVDPLLEKQMLIVQKRLGWIKELP